MSPDDLKKLSAVIDSRALMARCLNNLEFAQRILTMFEGRCETELAELDQALEQGDIESIRRIAHRLTGTCANAAAFEMQACASKLKHAADDCSIEETSDCLQELRREWQRFSEVMSSQRKASTPVSS
jgi:HPt (histidine-containing phosphotransfer) domain-containing protein